MQQVFFVLPGGIPIYGFGMMLFLCVVVCVRFAQRKVAPMGLNADRMYDLAIVLFVTGLIGARLTFMIQYDRSLLDFFRIWEGGIVFYGSLIGGFFGFWAFWYIVIRKLGISPFRIGDVLAPALCIGLVLGRVGCFLNGCCYGHVAEGATFQSHFPMLTAPSRDTMIKNGWLTPSGFTATQAANEDPRTVVDGVEPDSAAERAGLLPGDKLIRINGRPNIGLLFASSSPDKIDDISARLRRANLSVKSIAGAPGDSAIEIGVESIDRWIEAREMLRQAGIGARGVDLFAEMLPDWPKGSQSMQLAVERKGEVVELPSFTPRTLGLHPTQIYEAISAALLVFLLLSFTPYRRHDGQVFVLMLIGYAVHRIINEMLRDDTENVAFGMTLSMNIGILMIVGAVVMEVYLRLTQENRWAKGFWEAPVRVPREGVSATTSEPETK